LKGELKSKRQSKKKKKNKAKFKKKIENLQRKLFTLEKGFTKIGKTILKSL